jgi:hypothetical protein
MAIKKYWIELNWIELNWIELNYNTWTMLFSVITTFKSYCQTLFFAAAQAETNSGTQTFRESKWHGTWSLGAKQSSTPIKSWVQTKEVHWKKNKKWGDILQDARWRGRPTRKRGSLSQDFISSGDSDRETTRHTLLPVGWGHDVGSRGHSVYIHILAISLIRTIREIRIRIYLPFWPDNVMRDLHCWVWKQSSISALFSLSLTQGHINMLLDTQVCFRISPACLYNGHSIWQYWKKSHPRHSAV